MTKTYSSLVQLPTREERYQYLRVSGTVCDLTFGYSRYLNQALYKSSKWKHTRDLVIVRDEGCDMAMSEFRIFNKIIVHHINPLTVQDLTTNSSGIYDLENLVCVSMETHNAIHYGDKNQLTSAYTERSKNDTCPWA